MHLFHIPQYTIQNRNVHISVLTCELWEMEYVHCGICYIGLLAHWAITKPQDLNILMFQWDGTKQNNKIVHILIMKEIYW